MRVILAHNYYQQSGGEDQVFADEAALLESNGHEVIRFVRRNEAIDGMGVAALAASTLWNRQVACELGELCRRVRPAVAHFHNTFPLISPAAYYAVRREGVAVVQTLHNYRLICPNGLMFRDGRPCQACLGWPVALPGIARGCYRGSRTASAAVALMVSGHRAMGTWRKAVDRYIALSECSKREFVAGGVPADRITVKPNFVFPTPSPGNGGGGYALFVGRLSPEKGVDTLLEAWRQLRDDLPLMIAGAGPLEGAVREAEGSGIRWVGQRSPEEILTLMGEAQLVVVPSRWRETFGRVVIEAFAKGTPVVASDLGAMAELVENGRTGRHFRSGDVDDLVVQTRRMIESPQRLAEMRRAARETFEQCYSGESNHRQLTWIYEAAIRQRRETRGGDVRVLRGPDGPLVDSSRAAPRSG